MTGESRSTRTRAAMWLLLAVVAGAAAVLSFASLRDLATMCGFSSGLAWLLPVVIDAGAAAGCLTWLSAGGEIPQLRSVDLGSLSVTGETAQLADVGRRFARRLTLTLLAASVAGNAVVHGLTAYHRAAPWWLVVGVSGVAPAVLGAVVHLAVLVSQSRTEGAVWAADGLDEGDPYEVPADPWADAPYAADESGRAAELVAAGLGRRALARELGITEHEARQMLAGRNGSGVAS